jgi:hypothetical protein
MEGNAMEELERMNGKIYAVCLLILFIPFVLPGCIEKGKEHHELDAGMTETDLKSGESPNKKEEADEHRVVTKRALSGIVGPESLGKAYDGEFFALNEPVYANSSVRKVSSSECTVERFILDDLRTAALNTRVWGLCSIEDVQYYMMRCAVFRVYEVEHIWELDDLGRPAAVDGNAVYYLWRIYVGRLYEHVVHGDIGSLTKSVAEEFINAKGDIGSFVERNRLKQNIFRRGLRSTWGDEKFCEKENIAEYYQPEEARATSILAEYKVIPGREEPRTGSLLFKEGEPSANNNMIRVNLEIEKVVIAAHRKGGEDWDEVNGGVPDPMIKIFLNECISERKIHESSVLTDTLEPVWDNLVTLESELGDRLCIQLWDHDDAGNELIAECFSKQMVKWVGTQEIQCGGTAKIYLRSSI